jgi:hypothetical protein
MAPPDPSFVLTKLKPEFGKKHVPPVSIFVHWQLAPPHSPSLALLGYVWGKGESDFFATFPERFSRCTLIL